MDTVISYREMSQDTSSSDVISSLYFNFTSSESHIWSPRQQKNDVASYVICKLNVRSVANRTQHSFFKSTWNKYPNMEKAIHHINTKSTMTSLNLSGVHALPAALNTSHVLRLSSKKSERGEGDASDKHTRGLRDMWTTQTDDQWWAKVFWLLFCWVFFPPHLVRLDLKGRD